jgi:F-type H+-transporting ATPase subunit b
MEQTLIALGGILLKAIPTVVIVLLLHWYLKAMLFGPLGKVLKQREEATAGARKHAEDSRKLADKLAAEFDQAIVQARAAVYREQEAQRKQWMADQAEQVRQARQHAEQAVSAARADLEKESATARESLVDASAELADQIASNILRQEAHA